MKNGLLHIILLTILFNLHSFPIKGQEQSIKMNVLPKNYYRASIEGNDTIAIITLHSIYVFPKPKFRNKQEEVKYWKLVRDVKKTLPYAKMVYNTLIETYEYIETMPTEEERIKHLKRMEKELFAQYKPELKKLTFAQGKLLIKLIDRECNQTSFHLIKAFLGSFRAGFWNIFAGMFGASLKTEYDPQGKDAQIEQIVLLVESGML